MKLMELQLCINNISRCLDKVYLLSERILDNQLNTIIKCSNTFTSQLYTSHNKIQQASDIQPNFKSIIKAQQTMYYSLCLPPLTQNPDPLRILLSLLKPPALPPRLHHLCQKITLTMYSTTFIFSCKK